METLSYPGTTSSHGLGAETSEQSARYGITRLAI